MQSSSHDQPEGQAPTEEELRGLCGDLLRSWRDAFLHMEAIQLGVAGEVPDSTRFSVVLAFAAHTHHVTTAACDLMYAGDYASAIPLLRVGYESALTAAWAANSVEAARALRNQYVDNAKKLFDDAKATGWFDELDVASEQEHVDVAVSAKGQAGNFGNLCLALEPHGKWLYVMYRLLSGYSHASGAVLSLYLPEKEDDVFELAPRPVADGQSWWHAAATNLLHAGQALDRLDPSARRRPRLNEASEIIGWPEPLKLTEAAAGKLAAALEQRSRGQAIPVVDRREPSSGSTT